MINQKITYQMGPVLTIKYFFEITKQWGVGGECGAPRRAGHRGGCGGEEEYIDRGVVYYSGTWPVSRYRGLQMAIPRRRHLAAAASLRGRQVLPFLAAQTHNPSVLMGQATTAVRCKSASLELARRFHGEWNSS